MKKFLLFAIFVLLFLSEIARYFFVMVIMHLHEFCVVFVCGIVFFSFFTKRLILRKSTLLSVFIILTIHFSPIPRLLLYDLERKVSAPQKLPAYVDNIIILGGSFSLLEMRTLDNQHIVCNSAGSRLWEWIPLMYQYPQAKIIFTGTPLEAQLVRQVFSDLRIPEERLIVESQSRNTMDNARNTRIFCQKKISILVTSAFHMSRSYAIFKHEDHQTVPYPVNYFTNKISIEKRLISFLDGLNSLAWRTVIKEYAGIFDLYLKG